MLDFCIDLGRCRKRQRSRKRIKSITTGSARIKAAPATTCPRAWRILTCPICQPCPPRLIPTAGWITCMDAPICGMWGLMAVSRWMSGPTTWGCNTRARLWLCSSMHRDAVLRSLKAEACSSGCPSRGYRALPCPWSASLPGWGSRRWPKSGVIVGNRKPRGGDNSASGTTLPLKRRQTPGTHLFVSFVRLMTAIPAVFCVSTMPGR
jgi:hypothetical protein